MLRCDPVGLAWAKGRTGEQHAGELHLRSAEAKAERIITEELKRRGWKEGELAARRKNDPEKLELAARLRRETTLSIKAIAARVHLGSSKAANRRLHGYMRGVGQGGAGPGQLKTRAKETPEMTQTMG